MDPLLCKLKANPAHAVLQQLLLPARPGIQLMQSMLVYLYKQT